MVAWNTGSVANEIQTIVEDIPSYISGAPLENIADRKREFVQTYTGETIAAGNIPSKYQSPILLLAMAETLSLMGLKGADVASFSLGDLSVNKGQGGNLQASSEMFERRAMEELQKVGRKVNFYKALG